MVKDIKAGEKFSTENIRVIRPGDGLESKYWEQLLGTNSLRDYKRGEPFNFHK